VLQIIAMRLTDNTRNVDTVSRYGGDEFLCLLTLLHEENDVAIIAAKILKAVQAPCEVRVGDAVVTLCIRASIGIAMFPKDGATAVSLIARADEAMYGAKESQSGIAFAHGTDARAPAYRPTDGGGIACQDAASRIFDLESSPNNRSLPAKGRKTV
jgi:diguanylate cyclase (GGDEF)-like protein